MYPIELDEIYKSYRVLVARDVEYLRCMFIQVNERLSLFHSITYPICNMVGVIFTNIVGCSIGELGNKMWTIGDCGKQSVTLVTSVVQIHPFQLFLGNLQQFLIINYLLIKD